MTNIYAPANTSKRRFYSVSSDFPLSNDEVRIIIAKNISASCTESILHAVKKMSRDISAFANDAIQKR